MEPACSQNKCVANGPGGFCNTHADCQDTRWNCVDNTCQPLGPDIGPCTVDEDCDTQMCCAAAPCTIGKCCLGSTSPCSAIGDCCSNNCLPSKLCF